VPVEVIQFTGARSMVQGAEMKCKM